MAVVVFVVVGGVDVVVVRAVVRIVRNVDVVVVVVGDVVVYNSRIGPDVTAAGILTLFGTIGCNLSSGGRNRNRGSGWRLSSSTSSSSSFSTSPAADPTEPSPVNG